MMDAKTHEKFKLKLAGSRIAVGVTAILYTAKGYSSHIPPDMVAETLEDRKENSDGGDMMMKKDGVVYRVEVKRLTRNFTEDKWCLPQQEFIVDSVASFDKKEVKPDFYIAWSHDFKCYGIVKNKDFKYKFKGDRFDKDMKMKKPFYLVDLGFVDFHNVEIDFGVAEK